MMARRDNRAAKVAASIAAGLLATFGLFAEFEKTEAGLSPNLSEQCTPGGQLLVLLGAPGERLHSDCVEKRNAAWAEEQRVAAGGTPGPLTLLCADEKSELLRPSYRMGCTCGKFVKTDLLKDL